MEKPTRPKYCKINLETLNETKRDCEAIGYKSAMRQVTGLLLTGDANLIEGPTEDYYIETRELMEVLNHILMKRDLTFKEIKEAYLKRVKNDLA